MTNPSSLSHEIATALEKITPGKWHAPGLGEVHSDHDNGIYAGVAADGENDPVIADGCSDENADFIAKAPDLLRRALAALQQQGWRDAAAAVLENERANKLLAEVEALRQAQARCSCGQQGSSNRAVCHGHGATCHCSCHVASVDPLPQQEDCHDPQECRHRIALCQKCGEPECKHGPFGFRDHAWVDPLPVDK